MRSFQRMHWYTGHQTTNLANGIAPKFLDWTSPAKNGTLPESQPSSGSLVFIFSDKLCVNSNDKKESSTLSSYSASQLTSRPGLLPPKAARLRVWGGPTETDAKGTAERGAKAVDHKWWGCCEAPLEAKWKSCHVPGSDGSACGQNGGSSHERNNVTRPKSERASRTANSKSILHQQLLGQEILSHSHSACGTLRRPPLILWSALIHVAWNTFSSVICKHQQISLPLPRG